MINLSIHDPKFTNANRFTSGGVSLVSVNISGGGGQNVPIIFSDTELAEKIIRVFEEHQCKATEKLQAVDE